MATITLTALPTSMADFTILAAQYPTTSPDNTCALFICALTLYAKNPTDGIAALNTLRGPRPMNGFDTQFIRDRFRGKEYLATAYFDGATPENGYAVAPPYTLTVMDDLRPQDVEAGYLRRFLTTAGADSPRPIKLRNKPSTGEWFLWEYSSILSGIRIPAAADPWA